MVKTQKLIFATIIENPIDFVQSINKENRRYPKISAVFFMVAAEGLEPPTRGL